MLHSNVCQPMTKWYSLLWYPLYLVVGLNKGLNFLVVPYTCSNYSSAHCKCKIHSEVLSVYITQLSSLIVVHATGIDIKLLNKLKFKKFKIKFKNISSWMMRLEQSSSLNINEANDENDPNIRWELNYSKLLQNTDWNDIFNHLDLTTVIFFQHLDTDNLSVIRLKQFQHHLHW